MILVRSRRQKKQRRVMIRKASENLALTSTRILSMPLHPPAPMKNLIAPPTVGQKVSRIEEETELNTDLRQNSKA